MPIETMLPVLLAASGCVVAIRLFATLGQRSTGFHAGDYRAKPLLTRWEMAAPREIRCDLPPGHHACTQVRLADVVELVERDPTRRRAALYASGMSWWIPCCGSAAFRCCASGLASV